MQRLNHWFQCSSASRKFLRNCPTRGESDQQVSVLFSEPKIPHAVPRYSHRRRCEFQCSSASRKFLNAALTDAQTGVVLCFSALQRAENSSRGVSGARRDRGACFSALQRAENSSYRCCDTADDQPACFSALQRAENSSQRRTALYRADRTRVSVLFSEPKIPQ